jgi:hypothetical protein
MTSHSGPLYEVTIFVAPDVTESCESRIEEHVRGVLQDPAIADCIVFARDSGSPERQQRVCLHILASDEALDEFIDGPGSEFEGKLEAEFSDQIEVQSRVLREGSGASTAAPVASAPGAASSAFGNLYLTRSATCSKSIHASGRR